MPFTNEQLEDLVNSARLAEEDVKEILEDIKELETCLRERVNPKVRCEIRGTLWARTATPNTTLDLDIFLASHAQWKHTPKEKNMWVNFFNYHGEMWGKIREAVIELHLDTKEWKEFKLLGDSEWSVEVIWRGRLYYLRTFLNLKDGERVGNKDGESFRTILAKKSRTLERDKASYSDDPSEIKDQAVISRSLNLWPPEGAKTIDSIASNGLVLFKLLTAQYRHPVEVSLKSGASYNHLPAFPENHVWQEFFAWFYKYKTVLESIENLTTLEFFVDALKFIEEATQSRGNGCEVVLGQTEAMATKKRGLQIRREPGGVDLCKSFYNWPDLFDIVSTFVWNYEDEEWSLCQLFKLNEEPWVKVTRLQKFILSPTAKQHRQEIVQDEIVQGVDESKCEKPAQQDYEVNATSKTPYSRIPPPSYHKKEEKQALLRPRHNLQSASQNQEMKESPAPVQQFQERSQVQSLPTVVLVTDTVIVGNREVLSELGKPNHHGSRDAVPSLARRRVERKAGKRSNGDIAQDIKIPLLEILRNAGDKSMNKLELRKELPQEIRPATAGPVNCALSILKDEGAVEEMPAADGSKKPRWKYVSG